MKKVAPQLENSLSLMDPSYGDIPDFVGVLRTYSMNEKESIVQIVLNCFSPANLQNMAIDRDAFDYALLVIPYGLRYDDENDPFSFFLTSFNLIFNWIEELPIETDSQTRQKYIQRFLIQLTQIFLNPSFKNHISEYCTNIQRIFLPGSIPLSEETKSVLINTMICGCIDIQKWKEFEILANLLIDTLIIYLTDAKNWFDPFVKRIQPLFQEPQFLSIITTKFEFSYTSFIKNPNPLAEKNMAFLKYLIDSYFPVKAKHEAFDRVIACWYNINQENSKIVNETKKLFEQKWPTETIKSMFFSWFSIDYECVLTKLNYLPIFELLKFGEAETSPELQKIGEEIIIREFSFPEKSSDYWLIPIYSLSFFQNHPMFLIEDNHYEMIFQFAEKLKRNNDLSEKQLMVTTSLISIIHQLLELSIALNRGDLIERVSTCLGSFQSKNAFLNLMILFSLFSAKRYDMLWNKLMACITNSSFGSNLYVFYIYAAFFTLLSDDVFKYYKFPKEFWDNLKSGILRTDGAFRNMYFLSLFTFARHTKLFKLFPEQGSFYQNFLISQGDKKPFLSYPYYLKIAILANQFNEIEPASPNDYQNSKHFSTGRYIISIVDNNTIQIRSPLGRNTIKIVKTHGSELKLSPYQQQIQSQNSNDKNSDSSYSSNQKSCLSMETTQSKELEKLFARIPDAIDFTPYEPEPKKDPCYESFNFLSNIGFFSLDEAENIKIISQENIKLISSLDKISVIPQFYVEIYQAIADSDSLKSVQTPKLSKFIKDIKEEVRNDICNIKYIIPYLSDQNINKDKSKKKPKALLLLNETNLMVKKYNQDMSEYDYTLIITPIEYDLYNVETVNAIDLPPPFHNSTIVHSSQIGMLISFMIMLFFASPIESKKSESGPNVFVNQMEQRTQLISQLFNSPKITPAEAVIVFTKFNK